MRQELITKNLTPKTRLRLLVVSRKSLVSSRSGVIQHRFGVRNGGADLSSTAFSPRKSGAGFTLIEVIISLGIIGILASGFTLGLSNFLNSRTLTDAANGIAATLRNAEVRAASGENNSSWGVRFVNNAVNPDYYQLFYGPSFASGTLVSKTYIPSRVQLSNPASGATLDIIFAQTTGLPNAAASVTIQLISNPSSLLAVSVNSLGAISSATALGVAPTVTAASPSSRGRGAVSQSIVITGTGFVSGASASFSGSGISTNSTAFNSSTQVTADISIAESASLGARNVIVTNSDAQFGTCTGCFTVNAGPTTISANPSSLQQGASAQNVVITGTGYASGASASFSGDGITVNQTTFQSATEVTANVSITAGASATARDITVTNSTDAGAGTGTDIFTVSAGVTYETAGGGANASGGGSCVAAAAWTDTEACVMVPAGTPTGSQPSKLRSNSLDSNTSSFTGQ